MIKCHGWLLLAEGASLAASKILFRLLTGTGFGRYDLTLLLSLIASKTSKSILPLCPQGLLPALLFSCP